MVKKQLRQLFYDVYKIAEQEAALKHRTLSKSSVMLLRILAAKYRAGLHPHLELIAKYIGQGLLVNEVQLEGKVFILFYTWNINRAEPSRIASEIAVLNKHVKNVNFCLEWYLQKRSGKLPTLPCCLYLYVVNRKLHKNK